MEGITTEINRLVGQEIAKVYAGSITETEMKNTAARIWNEFTSSGTRRYREYTTAEELIRKAMVDALNEEVRKLTNTDEFRLRILGMASDIVDEVVAETRRKIIDGVSDRLAQLSCGYGGMGLDTLIMETINKYR